MLEYERINGSCLLWGHLQWERNLKEAASSYCNTRLGSYTHLVILLFVYLIMQKPSDLNYKYASKHEGVLFCDSLNSISMLLFILVNKQNQLCVIVAMLDVFSLLILTMIDSGCCDRPSSWCYHVSVSNFPLYVLVYILVAVNWSIWYALFLYFWWAYLL